MQRGRSVDRGDRMARADKVRDQAFKAIDITADRRNPVRVEAVLNVFPFITIDAWFRKRN